MFCAFYVPEFRLHAALRHRPEGWREAAAVVDEETSLVLERTGPAARAGVAPGMSAAQALARCLRLRLLPREREGEWRLSALLLEIACGASAYAEQTAENACTLDLQGCRAAGWEAWGRALLERFPPLELAARAGIAENADLAFLAAHAATAEEPLRVVADSRRFLEALPLAALAPPPPVEAVLRGWGIGTLGGLSRLTRGDVAARLGPEGAALWDRARGRSTRLLKLVRAPERFEEVFDFERELETAEPILFLLRRFADQLALRLDGLGLVAAQLHLSLPLADGGRHERRFTIPSPTADADVLFRVLETHFDGLRLEQPPTGVLLEAVAARPERRQFQLFENALRDPNRFAETMARLLAVVGEGRVGTPRRKATHRPDTYEVRLPEFDAEPEKEGGAAAKIGLPLRRFRPPFPARVHCGGAGRPHYIVSEQAHGEVARLLGPYRLSGDWWENGWSTEEWDVEMREGGGLYRLSRQGEHWLVEGCYDR